MQEKSNFNIFWKFFIFPIDKLLTPCYILFVNNNHSHSGGEQMPQPVKQFRKRNAILSYLKETPPLRWYSTI